MSADIGSDCRRAAAVSVFLINLSVDLLRCMKILENYEYYRIDETESTKDSTQLN